MFSFEVLTSVHSNPQQNGNYTINQSILVINITDILVGIVKGRNV